MKVLNIEAVSRLPQPDVTPSLEENLLRYYVRIHLYFCVIWRGVIN
jgi:hypothetical protein